MRVRVFGLGALEYAVLAPAACISAIVILVWGVAKPDPALTLPWAIAVPVGGAIALWLVSKRREAGARRGWRRTLGEGLEAIAVLPRLFTREH